LNQTDECLEFVFVMIPFGDWGRGSGDGNAACPSRRHH